MLNLHIDLLDNPSVNNLERQVNQLVNGSENELRVDNISPGQGFNYHMQRIADHIVNRKIAFIQTDYFDVKLDVVNALHLAVSENGDNAIFVMENPNVLQAHPEWCEVIAKFAADGHKVVYKNYR